MIAPGRALAVCLAAALGAGSARAVPCAPIEDASPALAARDGADRLSFLAARLRHDARRTRAWAWTWAAAYSALTAYNAIELGFATARDPTIDYGVGTAASAIGLVALAALPARVLADQRRLDRLLASAPPDADRCALVAQAERLLLRDAASERFGRGPLIHAGTFLFNFGLGLLLGAGFNHWTQAAIVMFTGIAVGELQVITRPSDVLDTLERYRAGRLDALAAREPPAWSLRLDLSPTHATVGVAVRY